MIFSEKLVLITNKVMKKKVALVLLFFYSFTVNAEQQDTLKLSDRKFYLGIELTTITYHSYYKDPSPAGHLTSGYFTPVFLLVGYKINDRVRAQTGIGYGGSSDKAEWSPNHQATDTVKYKAGSRTNVFSIPATVQVDLFKAFGRIPLYGTVSAITAYGSTKSSMTETLHEVPSTAYTKDKGVNVFLMAGLGTNYKISKRFSGYTELFLFKRNLTGDNSFDYDWEAYSPWGRRLFKSLAFGVNYKL
ncbi:outer membrane beta-barrel protein [Pontibacter sp. BT731]|uniref:outer membrane beta-barrel protein n=1 Tax=Pontibacter coccineus TaxID=3063328 RepID=UPI0026E46FD8|nr:outer membrane beta-barrel protein [Pontibacter sp. BT731]MDO6389559.1 outer membrane beta-barrel protein [Pontibacter sp. BT731]